jgi:hypothetical protein
MVNRELNDDESDLYPEADVWNLKVEITVPDGLLPSPRTYHATCIINDFMIVIGGEADSDLNDLWIFKFKSNSWVKPDIKGIQSFTPKRFHSASII